MLALILHVERALTLKLKLELIRKLFVPHYAAWTSVLSNKYLLGLLLLVFTFQSTLFTCCGQNRLQKYSEVKGTSDKSSLPTHLISKKEYMHYISNHHDIGGTPFSHVCTQEFQPLGYCSQLTYVDIGFLCFHLCQLQNFLSCEREKSFEQAGNPDYLSRPR